MNILVINGSPKGDYSITLQTLKYIEMNNPEHTFTVLNVGRSIKRYEKDFSKAVKSLTDAEIIIFSYPVYTFIAPSQLHRFVELMKESNIDFTGKFATQITTSKHFYDVTAHNYIQENCQDMSMKFVRGLSADMDDLTKKKGQKDALSFFSYFMWCVQNDVYEALPEKKKNFIPVTANVPQSIRNKSGDVVIVADIREDDTELKNMILRFQAVCEKKTRVVNIREFPFKGGCISCFNCATKGKCIYTDGFDSYLRENIQTADAIVIAFTISDHSMGSLFKLYDDRQFCNGHRTVTMGKSFAYLINGPYSEEKNLQMIVEGRAEVGNNFLAGVATNEKDTDAEIDKMAKKLCYAIDNSYIQPQNFLGVGGMKIFRDLIWLMQGLMKADHKFYKEHKQYDFPQKHTCTMLSMYLIGAMMSNEKLMKKAGNNVKEGMLAPYKKVFRNGKVKRK